MHAPRLNQLGISTTIPSYIPTLTVWFRTTVHNWWLNWFQNWFQNWFTWFRTGSSHPPRQKVVLGGPPARDKNRRPGYDRCEDTHDQQQPQPYLSLVSNLGQQQLEDLRDRRGKRRARYVDLSLKETKEKQGLIGGVWLLGIRLTTITNTVHA